MSDTDQVLDYEKPAHSITVECNALADAERYFDVLQEGGVVFSPLKKILGGSYGPS